MSSPVTRKTTDRAARSIAGHSVSRHPLPARGLDGSRLAAERGAHGRGDPARQPRGRAGEKGGGVAVGPEAEEENIGHDVDSIALCTLHRVTDARMPRVDGLLRRAEGAEKRRSRHALVGLRVAAGHPALVAEVPLHPFPRQPALREAVRQQGVGRARRAAAGKDDRRVPPRGKRGLDQREKQIGRLVGEVIGIGSRDDADGTLSRGTSPWRGPA